MEKLRELGHDVVTIQERGRATEGVSDESVLALAIEEQRVILTLNRKDFIRLHTLHPEHFGMIVCTIDPDFSGQALRIHTAIGNTPDLRGQLIRVNRPR